MNIVRRFKNNRNEFDYNTLVGSGAFGKVYKSFNQIDNNIYAIKKTPVTKESIKYALQEIRILSKLNHSNVVQYFSSWAELSKSEYNDESDEIVIKHPYSKCYYLHLQMEYCNSDLKCFLEMRKQLDLQQSKHIFTQILNGVKYIHDQGIIHRDIKPANILIKTIGNQFIVKISDFGLGKVLAKNFSDAEILTECTTYAGTELYASPEQYNGKSYSFSTDIYSLGIILFELVNLFTTSMERIIEITKLKKGEQLFTPPIILAMIHENPDLRPDIKYLANLFFDEPNDPYILCRDIVWGIVFQALIQ
jgi:serine/threonine protein kinase